MNTQHPKELLTTQQAADYLNVSRYFLERDRIKKADQKIPYIALGERLIRYRKTDLDEWLESRTFTPLSSNYA